MVTKYYELYFVLCDCSLDEDPVDAVCYLCIYVDALGTLTSYTAANVCRV